MRPIDADALIDEIKKDTQKVIKQDDRVGSFWLGYIAGLVIKQPTVHSELDSENLVRTIETGITATNSNDAYSLGMRNGMRWCKSLIDGAEPKFEDGVTRVGDGADSAELSPAQPEPHEGHWIEGKIYRDVIECNCSECGQLMTTAASVRMNYCPNCGAKMTISTK